MTLQKTAERVAETLARPAFDARAYHAGLDRSADARLQDGGWQAGEGMVVATIAFGMGIDKADVRVRRTTTTCRRASRATRRRSAAPGATAQPSVVELLACEADVPTLENFAFGDTPAEGSLRGVIGDLLGRGPGLRVELDGALRPLRHSPAGAAHRPHLPRAARGLAADHAFLRGLSAAAIAARRGGRRPVLGGAGAVSGCVARRRQTRPPVAVV